MAGVTIPASLPSVVAGKKRTPRLDGAEARQRLLLAGLQLFSAKGFAKTSTREIAQAAEVNIAAISYYFGDKAALYRAAFLEPFDNCHGDVSSFNGPELGLRQALEAFYTDFLAPLKQSELLQQCMRLHFREMIEPTGLWEEELQNEIKPSHLALAAVLCRHLGLARPDDEIHRLAFAIAALSLHMFVGRDLIDAIAPRLVKTPAAIDKTVQRLTDFAHAMVNAEAHRRLSAATPTTSNSV
jgi:AcrR family transcriptional regulator